MNDVTAPAPGPADDTAPAPGQADDKDWTWVLERPCPDCGVAVGAMSVAHIAQANRDNANAWVQLLASGASARDRPAADVWSPLEYACHVRDVFRLFLTRLDSMLDTDDPLFDNWNPNETAEAERYDLQDPAVVAVEVLDAGNALADRFAGLSAEQLDRPGRRSDGAAFTVLSFARYEIHDPLHHLWDVTGSATAVT